ncbi:hypothetical protein HPG69_006863 [Diceros bicornis minor]|uniref:Uncharacterized protein n=1 Tax=Diceros bicornis minor TaxID=77932 RepID=A0A7J7EL07_DICBM|nr:hypothetical protein HPG69_006863 [Diceros bicornis minor]
MGSTDSILETGCPVGARTLFTELTSSTAVCCSVQYTDPQNKTFRCQSPEQVQVVSVPFKGAVTVRGSPVPVVKRRPAQVKGDPIHSCLLSTSVQSQIQLVQSGAENFTSYYMYWVQQDKGLSGRDRSIQTAGAKSMHQSSRAESS